MGFNINYYKKIIMPIIEKYLPKAKIILYGSRARGDSQEGSDIDIALDIGHKIERHIIVKIIEDLESSTLPINFDIVDLNNVSKELKEQILKYGKIWK